MNKIAHINWEGMTKEEQEAFLRLNKECSLCGCPGAHFCTGKKIPDEPSSWRK